MLLNLVEILKLSLLLFNIVGLSLDLLHKVALGCIHLRLLLFLEIAVCLLPHRLFFLLLPLSFMSLCGDLHVTLSRPEDGSSARLGLVEFLPGLYNKETCDECVCEIRYFTFYSSCLSRAIRLESSLWSSSALLRAIFAAINFRCKVSSSSSSYTFRSISWPPTAAADDVNYWFAS